MSDRLVTPEFRMSFAYLLTPDKKGKYGVAMLFPKGADLSALKAAALEAARDEWGDTPPKGIRSPFRNQGEQDYDGYEEGAIFVSARSNNRPGVVDSKGQTIIDPSKIYSGCWGHAEINAFAYDVEGNKGVTFGLNHVLKTRDGEPLGGGGGDPKAAFTSIISSNKSQSSGADEASSSDDIFG